MNKNDIIEYVMTTPHNTNRAVLSSMLNQLIEGGGGGSSDFSTATVTFGGNGEVTVVMYGALATDGINSSSMSNGDFMSGDECQLILYKGKASIGIEGVTEDTLTVSGNITSEGNGNYIVTGDCTITLPEVAES